MKKRLISLVLLLLCVISLAGCGKRVPDTPSISGQCTPLLYEVTDGQGNTVWLFGSIHVGRESFYPLPDYVMNAYNQADALAVEFDVLAYQEDLTAMTKDLQDMVYTDGSTIADHIPQPLYEDCVKIMKENNSYNAMMDSYNIAMWAQFIESFTMEQAGADTELGIDVHFLGLAHQEGKTILNIESASEQYGIMADLPQELQVTLLESAVANYGQAELYAQSLQVMLNAWQLGNATLLSILAAPTAQSQEEAALFDEYNNAMITERNENMTDFAENALKTGQKLFICVGAAHVVGDGGIAKLLEARGYTVRVVE